MSCAELDSGIAPISDEELAELSIFPLPQCVLLPGGLLPLHVFEPRYRELTRHCLEGNRPIGVARLRPSHGAHGARGAPAVYPHVGVGRIICSEELEDGRFLLLLRGAARVVIERELPTTRRFRQVAARRLYDCEADAEVVRNLHHQLMAICDRLALVLDEGGRQLRELAYGDTPGACADAVSAALLMDADERQALLEQTDPQARLNTALAQVSRLLCQVVPCQGMVN
ncbi:MAG: LON peptidase substrate-binding domain-containing protein [Kofleriaceae bacterium]